MFGRWRVAALAVALVVAGVVSGTLGQERLSAHQGFWLIASDEPAPSAPSMPAAAFQRPRRVYVIVLDGLRADRAREMASVGRLTAGGHCGVARAAMPTLSMPAYATLSTGVEAERSGVRTNGRHEPAAAESIWEVAREAGLRVVGVSSLPWWTELFPRGFDHFDVVPHAVDAFALAAPARTGSADIVLVHPLYIDEAGHQHGAASSEYSAAVARADRELGALLEHVDLASDSVVLTADHGHVARGGHGGTQPDVTKVLTCLAGRGFTPAGSAGEGAPAPSHRELATILALIEGLRLPRHTVPPERIDPRIDLSADQRAARLRGFASARATQLRGLEGETWTSLRARERRKQWIRVGSSLLAALIALYLGRSRWKTFAWMAVVAAVHVAVYIAVRGSFDGTSVNTRADWIITSLTIGAGAGALGAVAHRRLFGDGDPTRISRDLLALAAMGVVVDVMHAVTFGWPMGYPLPRAQIMFGPFFLSTFIVAHAALALVFALAIRDRASASRAASSAARL